MGKEDFNEEVAGAAVETKLNNSNLPNLDIINEAKKEDAEKERAELKERTRKQLQADDYNQAFDLLKQRYSKKRTDITTEKLKAVSAENEEYATGQKSLESHREELNKIVEVETKAVNKLVNDYGKLFTKLREEKPDGYRQSHRSWNHWNGCED